eukprot:1155323-Pelagomonas_calceolata.AAC.4
MQAVVLAGCLPPADISRYFGFTGYIHSIWTRTGWSNVFGSLGDTLSIYTVNTNGSTPLGVRNRLNSSLPDSDADRPHGQFSVVSSLTSFESLTNTDAERKIWQFKSGRAHVVDQQALLIQ